MESVSVIWEASLYGMASNTIENAPASCRACAVRRREVAALTDLPCTRYPELSSVHCMLATRRNQKAMASPYCMPLWHQPNMSHNWNPHPRHLPHDIYNFFPAFHLYGFRSTFPHKPDSVRKRIPNPSGKRPKWHIRNDKCTLRASHDSLGMVNHLIECKARRRVVTECYLGPRLAY